MARRGRPPKIINKATQAHLQATGSIDPLPPPGDYRREELKVRDALLEEAAEELGKDRGAIDPQALEMNAEAFGLLNRVEAISGEQPGWQYCWTWTGQNGYFIKQKSLQGWKLVQGEDAEARDLRDSNPPGLRRTVDTVLMKIPQEQYDRITRYQTELANRQRLAVMEPAKALAKKHGLMLHLTGEDLDLDSPIIQRAIQQAALRQQAVKGIDKMLRQGTAGL